MMESLLDLISRAKSESPDTISSLLSAETSSVAAQIAIQQHVFDDLVDISPAFRDKCPQRAEELRAEGNTLFKSRRYGDALRRYSESLLYAPWDHTSRALAHGNRSAVLYQAGRYSACLQEVEASLRAGYPADLRGRLEERAARSRQVLEGATSTSEPPQIPEITQLNESVPSAASCLSIRSGPSVGRYVVTTEPVAVGDALIVEKPLASVIYPAYYTSLCYHCAGAVDLPFPCRQCAAVKFCSEECSVEAWDRYHAVECQYLDWLAETWVSRLGHLALRLLLTCRSDESWGSVCSLERNEEARDSESRLQLVAMGAYLTRVVTQSGTGYDPVTTCQRLVTALQAVQCNGVALTHMADPASFQLSSPVAVGQALYLTTAMCNHSCDPSAELVSYGDTCVLRAVRDLAPGDEVSFDYGPVFYLESRPARQDHLRDNYFFTCNCLACQEDWPTFDAMTAGTPTWRCESCGGPVTAPPVCPQCTSSMSVADAVRQLAESHDRYATAAADALAGRVSAALPGLHHHVSVLQCRVCPPWGDLSRCQATVKQCYRILGTQYARRQLVWDWLAGLDTQGEV